MTELIINLPEKTYKALKDYAEYHNLSVEELAEEELEKIYG